MFQQLANLWECHRDHKNNRGAMCISPDRVLYFADCNDNIYSYNLRDNVLQKIYTHDELLTTYTGPISVSVLWILGITSVINYVI